jgi:DNA-binding NarL/FixJ family response regulator
MTDGARKFKVLCVDDSVDACTVLGLALRDSAEFEVVGLLHRACDVERAVAIDAPDLVVLDLWMPGERPLEVLQRVRQRHPSVRFLVCSSDDDAGSAATAMQAGASGFVVKDGDFRRLLHSMRAVMAGATVRPQGGTRNRMEQGG